jgi:8-oxo-dGTP diphosphatase
MSVYTPPILTVDNVVFSLIAGDLSVLLVERANDPFKGVRALPGGYNAAGETTMDAVARVLKSKAGINLSELNYIEQLYTFDTVARDPRGHAVSVSYMGLCRDIVIPLDKGLQNPQFFPVKNLPKLAYDHVDIISYAHTRLCFKITYTNVVWALLPNMFTLTQLQSAYESILMKSLDKRNFRKKFLSLGLVVASKEFFKDGAHRPARLYRFKKQSLEVLSRSFD